MARPRSYKAGSNGFFGDERVYTRQRFYRRDDGDLRAEAHETSREVEQDLSKFDEDPYEEGGYVGFDEANVAKDQFKSDVADDRFLTMIRRNRRMPDEADDEQAVHQRPSGDAIASYDELHRARQREARVRDEIIRAMERSQRQASLFTVNYAACVPPEYVAEFLFGIEAGSVVQALKPMLLIRKDRLRYHMEEGQMRRVMYDVGCHFERGETRVLQGHLRQHVPLPPEENGWYSDELLESEHAHFDEQAGTTTMRVLTFQIDNPGAASEDALKKDASDAAGYRVKIVTHLVKQHKDRDVLNVLCFRTFHFSRYL